MGFNAELMYPSHVMKLTSFSEGQHDAQNGTITYLSAWNKRVIQAGCDNNRETFTYIRKNGSQQTTKTPIVFAKWREMSNGKRENMLVSVYNYKTSIISLLKVADGVCCWDSDGPFVPAEHCTTQQKATMVQKNARHERINEYIYNSRGFSHPL